MKAGISSSPLPLIRHDRPDDIVAYRDGNAITAAQFLADVRFLAERLLPRPHVMNRCADRYHFAVGFAAALVRRQITLLPPNDTPELLGQLAEQYSEMYCLTDELMPGADMEQVPYPASTRASSEDFVVPAFDHNQIAALLFTSGSTGRPLPYAKRWGLLVESTKQAGRWLGVSKLPAAAVMATVPPQHSYGLESSVMLPFQHGLALTAAKLFYPADIVELMRTLPRPRILVTTPIHLRLLSAEATTVPQADLVVSATAPLTSAMAAEAEARFGCPLIEIYGCAEAGQTAARHTSSEVEWSCLDGITLSQDEQGTWASGALVDRKVMLNDVIELTGAGRFVLLGRTADLVNIAGKRTSLANLNFHLNAIPGVKDGIFVIPDGETHERARLVAFVVSPSLSPQTVIRELRRRIDPLFLPRPLCFVDVLPRNSTGKLTRNEVEKLLDAAKAPKYATTTSEIAFPSEIACTSGHFPGDPIIPGAVLLQEVVRALSGETERFVHACQIRSAKFIRPVRPGDRMVIRWDASDSGDMRFECSVNQQPVLTGVIGDSETML